MDCIYVLLYRGQSTFSRSEKARTYSLSVKCIPINISIQQLECVLLRIRFLI